MSASLPKQWLDRAAEDLTVARLILAEGHYSHACFLAQQCIEKSLKAFLLEKVNSYPRAHRLIDLLLACEVHEPACVAFRADCLVVDQYYIPTRYPDGVPGGLPGGLPGDIEADEAVTAAESVLRFISLRIP
ncbi:MAG: HEPN domain-containing protein [Chloroflexi bacterium]|nr:HEPN domain-containing protein [Chloroflexota bacterium]